MLTMLLSFSGRTRHQRLSSPTSLHDLTQEERLLWHSYIDKLRASGVVFLDARADN